jgi:hypothetical protein
VKTRSLLLALGAIFVISALLFIFWWDTSIYVLYGNIVQITALALAATNMTGAASAASERGSGWRNWAWIAGGAWMWVLGQLWEAVAELVLKMSAYGTVADCFWVVGLMMFILGLAGMIRDKSRAGHPPRGILAAASVCSAAAIVLILQVWQHAFSPQRDFFRSTLDLLYPLFNLTVVCGALVLFSARRQGILVSGAPGASLRCLLCWGPCWMPHGRIWVKQALFRTAFRI